MEKRSKRLYFRLVSISVTCVLVAMLFSSCTFGGSTPNSTSSTTSKKSGTSTSSTTSESTEPTASDSEPTTSMSNKNGTDANGVVGTQTTSASTRTMVIRKDIPTLELNIKNSKAISENFMGFGGLYSCHAYVDDKVDRGYDQDLLNQEMDRIAGAGTTIVRSLFRYNWCWDANADEYDWESSSMLGVYKWCKEMADRGIEVALCAGGEYATSSKLTYGYENPFYVLAGGDFDGCIEYYGKWVAELLNQLLKHGVTNVHYFLMFTEPGDPWSSSKYENQVASLQTYKAHCIAADRELKAAGLRDKIKLVGPNVADSLQMLKYCIEDDQLGRIFDIYSYHSYDRTSLTEDSYWSSSNYEGVLEAVSMAHSAGKELWIDECGMLKYGNVTNEEFRDDGWHGTSNAMQMIAAMNAGAQTFLRWSLVDQFWPDDANNTADGEWKSGAQRCGLLRNCTVSTVPYKGYYAYSMISKYCSGIGTKVYEGVSDGGSVYTSAVKNKDGEWTVVAVNMGYTKQQVKINFEKSIDKALFRHEYNPYTIEPDTNATIIQATSTMGKVSNTFVDSIGAGCVVVYTSIK